MNQVAFAAHPIPFYHGLAFHSAFVRPAASSSASAGECHDSRKTPETVSALPGLHDDSAGVVVRRSIFFDARIEAWARRRRNR